ncbi:class I adenylate-forming enzyme family protein [Maricaulis sp.]|uniref:class I adenylate-forming enzyme family protein n=1 Tax=Maricaulis sp. TaxID=1486257 RepID=UPI0026066CD4|nr:class I adenylate-forming enzyme family protein [Maricaulis sp.]MDF1768571.1 class I adenylate-forming enzyme family protein [Maricaulis sp.]
MAERKPAPPRAVLEQIARQVTEAEEVLNVAETDVLGVRQKAYVNAPADLRFLLLKAMEHGDKTAVVFEDQRWSFADLAARSVAVANALIDHHRVKPGTRVALAMRNCPEWMACFLGVIAAGGVIVPLNGWWTSEEMAFGLEDCGAKIVIAGARQIERIRPHAGRLGLTLISGRDEIDGVADTFDRMVAAGAGKAPPELVIETDSDFAIFYTSGSTGKPKGAVLTHRGAVTTILSFALLGAALKLANGNDEFVDGDPGVLVCLPLFHCTGSHAVFMLSVFAGRKMALMRKWDAGDAVDLIQAEKLTDMVGVPTMSHELTLEAERRGEVLETLQSMGTGGAKRPEAHVAKINDVFPQAWSSSGYGLTETNALGTYNGLAEYQAKPGSCGAPLPAVTFIKTVDENGAETPTGEPGEVWIQSPGVFRGYLNQPEATADVLTEDRWFKTGDVGIIDEDGFLFIVDRIKDMLLRGGENISCLEVEGALAHHPDILEAAVIGIPDERLGERVGAAILLRDGASLSDEDLKAFLKPHLAPFKIPEHVWRMDQALPRGGTSKIDKPGLRKMLLKDGETA